MITEIDFRLEYPDFTKRETDGPKGPTGYPQQLDPVHLRSGMSADGAVSSETSSLVRSPRSARKQR